MENKVTLFDIIRKFAEQKAKGAELNAFHVLYGIAAVLSLNESTLNTLINFEDGKTEVETVRKQIEEMELDLELIKIALPHILLRMSKEVSKENSVTAMLSDIQEKNGYIPVNILIRELDAVFHNKIELFKKGNTFEDVLKYAKSLETQSVSDEIKTDTPVLPTVKTEEKRTEDGTFSSLAEKIQILYRDLQRYVKGQDDAIRMFVRGYFQAQLMGNVKREKDNPSAVFLFAGPPGVGKTYPATIAAEALKLPVKRFNMSEYSDHQSPTELIGLSKKYQGGAAGALTGYVKKNPQSIIIFDEIEKAHLNVIHLFLQILDAGQLQDNYMEQNVSFKDTIIIFTTNVGKKLYEENRDKNLSLLDQTVVLDALQKEKHPLTGHSLFPTAICSRFASGNVIMFNHLGCHHLLQIVQKNFGKCADIMKKKFDYDIIYDERLASLFLFGQTTNSDARIIAAQSGIFVQNELYEFSRQAIDQIDLKEIKKIRFVVQLANEKPEIIELFENKSIEKILVFSDIFTTENLKDIDEHKQFLFANTMEDVKKILAEQEVSMMLLDPKSGLGLNGSNGFSMDDLDAEGVRCFNQVRTLMPQLPIYLLETDKEMREVDKGTFQQRGARGVVSFIDKDEASFVRKVSDIADAVYLQKKINDLSRKEKTLRFNTAQKISGDKSEAVIEFYDFELHTAIKAENQNTVMEETKKPSVKFSDIIGAKNARDELQYFIRYLKKPKEFMMKGSKPPKGIILYGPPGTGKTMLAKAMAGEAGVAFLPTTATDFMDKYVGEGEQKIRKLFLTARKYAPSVIFIDEIDAIGKERAGGSGQYTETLLNTLLTEMDGFSFDPERPVFVLAATNFPLSRDKANGKAIIDPALMRRFDNKIYVDLPNQEERKEFLSRKIAKIQGAQITEAALRNISERTTGESLAIMQNIFDLALRNANRKEVALNDEILLNALEEYYYGEEHRWGRAYYESVAHHEAGHAYVCHLSGVKPSFVTIVSRGDFGGYMQHGSEEKTPSYTKEQLLWRIRTSLAGRASEIVFYGEETGNNTGVSGDLQSATNLVLQMICRYGMSGRSLLSIDPDRLLGTPAGEKILMKAEEILEKEMEKTIQIIRDGKDKVEALSQALLIKNQLMGNEIDEIFSK